MPGIELYEHTFDFFLEGPEDEIETVTYYDQAYKHFFRSADLGHYYTVDRVDVENQLEYLLNNGIVFTNEKGGEARRAEKVKHVESEVYAKVPPFYVCRETIADKLMKPFSKLFGVSLIQNKYNIRVEVKHKTWESSSGNKPTHRIGMIDGHVKMEEDKLEKQKV